MKRMKNRDRKMKDKILKNITHEKEKEENLSHKNNCNKSK